MARTDETDTGRVGSARTRIVWAVAGIGLLLVAAAVVALVLGYVSFDDDPTGTLSYDGVAREVQEAKEAVRWPDRTPSDEALMIGLQESRGDRFEKGFGPMLVRSARACAWRRAWLDANTAGDRERQDELLPELEAALEDAWGIDAIGKRWVSDAIGSATVGDPSPLEEEPFAYSCDGWDLQ